MRKIDENHVFTGIQRDLSVSKHPVQFLYDGRNIRLTAREGDSLLSITNEKSTESTNISISGVYLGHCVLNQYLVVFSTTTDSENVGIDYITRIDLSNSAKEVLFQGVLGFSPDAPIKAIPSYETKAIQKVYWTDGLNQPRIINIIPTKAYTPKSFDFVRKLKLEETVKVEKLLGASGEFAPGVIQYAFTYFDRYGQESSIFYTTPLYYISYADRGASPEDKVGNAFKITISDVDDNFEFIRIYSIQRTSINGTPICKRVQDIELVGGGETSEESSITVYREPLALVDNEYKRIVDIDTNLVQTFDNVTYKGFKKGDYSNLIIRIGNTIITWGTSSTDYSVIWVSKSTGGIYYIKGDTSPSGGIVAQDMSITTGGNTVSYTDLGTSGNTIDPTELLYKGGEVISAGTICQKDNTMFLGDLKITRESLIKYKSSISSITLNSSSNVVRTIYPTVISNSNSSYAYANQLTAYSSNGRDNSVPCSCFKYGDVYRCGVQFQHESGKWSDPIFLRNKRIESKPVDNGNSLNLPRIEGIIPSTVSQTLLALNYKKVRAIVVFPQLKDRVSICQGVASPTVSTLNQQGDKSLEAQASWFFRCPIANNNYINTNGSCTVAPYYGTADTPNTTPTPGTIPYTSRIMKRTTVGSITYPVYDPSNIRQVEIQGEYNTGNKFNVNDKFITLNSPDIEFDDALSAIDYSSYGVRKAGSIEFTHTLSDISIQTETPPISGAGTGFVHKTFNQSDSYGIVSGLFYDDYIVDDKVDSNDNIGAFKNLRSSCKWLVYPWQSNGSLNNDINRPASKGTASAVLKKKVISNLRYATSNIATFDSNNSPLTTVYKPQLFYSNEVSILKFGNDIYKGNIDTAITPDYADGMYFCSEGINFDTVIYPVIKPVYTNADTSFGSTAWLKTWNIDTTSVSNNGIRKWVPAAGSNPAKWQLITQNIGDDYVDLNLRKSTIRMKYKSTPHLVFKISDSIFTTNKQLPLVEVYNPSNVGDKVVDNLFGGDSIDALKEQIWIPCGDPVALKSSGYTYFYYDWGDTYFQRWDCLKTYPFTKEDVNQIVEIASFMVETRTNIDGRYDRNRGQQDNLNMSPVNFNLINPVYSQLNNFFTYKILPEDYYTNTDFPNQITWTKEKQSGADVDMWTNVTLASTYDMDGSKGKVEELTTWKDNIFCFQNKGISNILFNSRVQIPVSDGVPIEISNNYKVDGYKYISDGIGCDDKQLIMSTPQGVYFIDSVGSHLFHIGDGFTDISAKNNMTSIFKKEKGNWKKLLYDDINHDLYLVKGDESLCYSEPLGQFTSWMNYADLKLIETYGGHVFTMKGIGTTYGLWRMFEGEGYNNFFDTNYPWGFTFVSNGTNEGIVGLDKTFTNVEFRASVEGDGELSQSTGKFTPALPFNSIETWNEYQHGYTTLENMVGHSAMVHGGVTSALKRKFRIWRCDIPRDNMNVNDTTENPMGIYRKDKHPLDRMRNPWLYLKVTKNAAGSNAYLTKTEVHDIMVSYFV